VSETLTPERSPNVSIQSEVGEAVGRFADTFSSQAAADPSAVGSVALSAVAVAGAAGLAWWRRKRPREGRSVVRAEVPAGQRLAIDVGGEKPKGA
jgi:hypothetical protein